MFRGSYWPISPQIAIRFVALIQLRVSFSGLSSSFIGVHLGGRESLKPESICLRGITITGPAIWWINENKVPYNDSYEFGAICEARSRLGEGVSVYYTSISSTTPTGLW